MKDKFKGFYSPTDSQIEDAWKDGSTIFVFDTNVLMNLYGYAEQTRKDFFEVLKKIEPKVWLPYQVGLEYQRRRLDVIKDEKAIFRKIDDSLSKIDKIFENDFNQLALARRFPKLSENTKELHKDISKLVSNYKRSVKYWDDKQPCVRSHDEIRSQIDEIVSGRIGDKPESQQWLDKLYQEGEIRYKNNIPPGFKDNGKGNAKDSTFSFDGLTYERKFGDLILWKQLIDKAKESDIKYVVFVTDDAKDDWWYTLDSRGKKTIGPHANLKTEIYQEAGVEFFHMYSTSTFLESGKKILEVGVHDSSIDEASVVQFYSHLPTRAHFVRNQEQVVRPFRRRKYVGPRVVYKANPSTVEVGDDVDIDDIAKEFRKQKAIFQYMMESIRKKDKSAKDLPEDDDFNEEDEGES
ncbi:PIN-like domain-containing protein [Vibrio natriegens]|uniref:PIN-like domain-containing protein n=1 Tax=Vibrio natriegens TaxID=691 RepID=UPI00228536CB|nr:PIN-like domain-containing protein [Vibrio natriegens]MCY9877303.1 PIN-like domain-containing protein [Vibrio natriegens]